MVRHLMMRYITVHHAMARYIVSIVPMDATQPLLSLTRTAFAPAAAIAVFGGPTKAPEPMPAESGGARWDAGDPWRRARRLAVNTNAEIHR